MCMRVLLVCLLLMRFVSTCVCVCVRACVHGFSQYVCICAVSVSAAVGVVHQYLCVLLEGAVSKVNTL